MKIKLIQQIPSNDGYYLMSFNKTGGLHLVLIMTELDGARVMYRDDTKEKVIQISPSHQEVLKDAYFSETPIGVEKV